MKPTRKVLSGHFKCGCPEHFDFEDYDFNLECQKTFDTLKRTPLGVFQLEGHTARKWLPEFAPKSVEEISDFTSLARPGPLESGMMTEYIDVKGQSKEHKYLHEDLKAILGKTHGALVYQEQIMEICRDIAGLSLVEADTIRKGVGKKKVEVLEKCAVMFETGCNTNKYSEELAGKVWSWIVKFAGYGFNKAHAICYSHIAYYTAWVKAHYPVEFFCACLQKSGSGNTEQTEEIMSIINDAKLFGIEVKPPNVRKLNIDFEVADDLTINFGLGHIKGIGKSSIVEVKKFDTDTYDGFIATLLSDSPKKTVVEALIWAGAFDYLEKSRYKLASDDFLIRSLTVKEKDWIDMNIEFEGDDSLQAHVEYLSLEVNIAERKGASELVPNKNRRATLRRLLVECQEIRDSSNFHLMLAKEKFYIGVAISGNESELYSSDYSCNNCIEFVDALDGSHLRFLCMVEKVRLHHDRKGNKMAFVKVSDQSYMVEGCVVFASTYRNVGHLLEEGSLVLLTGKKQGTSYLVNKISAI